MIITFRDVKSNECGRVVELLRREELPVTEFGQIYISTVKPGKVKANHFHKEKHEWICVIRGEGLVVLKDIEEDDNRREYVLSGGKPATIYVPPYIAHGIKNLGKEEMTLVIYSTRPYDRSDPDTFPLKVLE